MAGIIESGRRARDRVDPRGENVIPLPLPEHGDRQRVVDWALATVAEAERRVESLQRRIAYLEGLSVTDELTGLFNRRGFLGELDRTLATAQRSGVGGVLLLADLDGFKAINDRYGHGAGDDALRGFAQLIAGKIRRNDVFGRLGGDEFGVILTGAALGNARRKAQALTELVATTPFRTGGHRIVLGASFGLAPFHGEEQAEDLLNSADLAMYGEKRNNHGARSA